MIIIQIFAVVFIASLCIVLAGVPIWLTWKTFFGNGKVLGVSVRGWAAPWLIIAAVCAVVLIYSELPGILADRDPQAPVGMFFFGVVVSGLFPLSLLVGRCVLTVWRVASRQRSNTRDGVPEFVWILAGLALLGMASILIVMHRCNTRLRVEVSNRAASPETLREVYQKSRHNWVDYDIKCKLADHPRLPNDIVELLASDLDFGIRNRIALNPETDASVLRKLSHDSDRWVRQDVAWRDDCPDDVLSNLCIDAQANVQQAALKQMEKRKILPRR
ncbi:MAG: hypothetical protein WCH84_00265 [Verrucomicrobiota bacterium]